jgi:hypothetical protein
MMEVVRASETSVSFKESTRRYPTILSASWLNTLYRYSRTNNSKLQGVQIKYRYCCNTVRRFSNCWHEVRYRAQSSVSFIDFSTQIWPNHTHPLLALPNDFPAKIIYASLAASIVSTCSAHPLDFTILTIWVSCINNQASRYIVSLTALLYHLSIFLRILFLNIFLKIEVTFRIFTLQLVKLLVCLFLSLAIF